MTSKTGTNHTRSGFSLIEVMVTAAILALGTVFVFQSNLMNMNVYGRYVNRLYIQNWANQKIWETKEALFENDSPSLGQVSGDQEGKIKTYHWDLETKESALNDGGLNRLYEIVLNVSWPEGGGTSQIFRNSFVFKIKK